MAPPLDEANGNGRRRFNRKFAGRHRSRASHTVELPDRFKNDNDDADEDVMPQGQSTQNFMANQSIFGLIAAASSTADFANRFDASDDESHDGDAEDTHQQGRSNAKGKEPMDKSLARGHRRKISDTLLRSLPNLPKIPSRTSKSQPSKLKPHTTLNMTKPSTDPSSTDPSSTDTASISHDIGEDGDRAPVMSRMLEARAEMSSRPSFEAARRSGDHESAADANGAGTTLALRLKEIFELDEPEDVIQGTHPNLLLSATNPFSLILLTCRRVPLLVYAERVAPGLHVYHFQAYLLLCLFTQERGMNLPSSQIWPSKTNRRRMRSSSRDTFRRAARGTPDSTATGSS